MKRILTCLAAIALFNTAGALAAEVPDSKASAADTLTMRALEGTWYCVSNSMARASSTIRFEADGSLVETFLHEGKTVDRHLCSWRVLNQTIRIENRQWFRREKWLLSDAYWPSRTEWRILRMDDGILSVDELIDGERSRHLYVREEHLAEFDRKVSEFTGDDGTLRLIWDNTDRPMPALEHTPPKLVAPGGPAVADEPGLPSQPSLSFWEPETERSFALEREADVVVFYDTAKDLRLRRPEQGEPFASETALLEHLTRREEPKRLLVVILSKRHEFSDPKQTLDGFWQACRNTGFERVIIQRSRATGRPIVRE